MRKFLKNLSILIILVFLCDYFCHNILQIFRPIDYELFLNSKKEFFSEIKQTDILIVGDSHITDALDTRTIESKTNLFAYNLGIYHSSPFENYYLTHAAIEHLNTPPKLLILGTNPVMFQRQLSVGKYTPIVLPTKQKFQLIINSKEGINGSFFLKTIREKYLFKTLIKEMVGIKYQPTRKIEDVYNGHCKFFNQSRDVNWSDFREYLPDNPLDKQVEYFIKTIQLAQEKGIEVVIVNPPLFIDYHNVQETKESYNKFIETLTRISDQYDLTVHNIDKDKKLQLKKEYFLNPQHLNYFGSKIFSEQLATHLLEIIEEVSLKGSRDNSGEKVAKD